MNDLDRFVRLSAEITAFSSFELNGTGQVKPYYQKIVEVVGESTVADLLSAYDALSGTPHPEREVRLRREIFGDEKLGPVARNLVKLWYSGTWFALPKAWMETYGASDRNITLTVSGEAYTEGLLWPAIGAHPPGAKAPGYGSWFLPPQIPPIPPPLPPTPAPVSSAAGKA